MPEFDPRTRELLVGMLLLAGLLVVVALGIQVIAVYRRRLMTRSGDSPAELAEAFREAYEAGEIGTDEYRRIRATIERGPPPVPPRAEPAPPAPPDDPGLAAPGPPIAEQVPEAPGPAEESRPD